MGIKMVLFLLIIFFYSFSAPFFYHEIVLSNTKYTISIDSGQKVFNAMYSLCPNKQYYYFHYLKIPFNVADTLTIIKSTALQDGDTLSITYFNSPNNDSLLCDSSVKVNNVSKKNIVKDTTKILWGYPPPPTHKATSLSQYIAIEQQHIYFSLKNGNDSSSITLTKKRVIYTGTIMGLKAPTSLNTFTFLPITTFSSLRTSAASGANIVLFDMRGKKLFDSKRDNLSDKRLSGKVVLYKIENAHASPFCGKIIMP